MAVLGWQGRFFDKGQAVTLRLGRVFSFNQASIKLTLIKQSTYLFFMSE